MKKNRTQLYGVVGSLLMAMVAPAAFAADNAPLNAREGVDRAAPAAQNANRLIIRYKDGAVSAQDASRKQSVFAAASSRAGLSSVLAADGRTRALNASTVRRLGTGADLVQLSMKLSARELQKLVSELNNDPMVAYAEQDVLMRRVDSERVAAAAAPALVPNDQYYAQYQWHLHNAVGGINAPAAWDISTGTGTVVAVLDTGILPQHPDMQANLLTGYDFITDAFVSRRPTDERVPGALDYGDWEEANDCGAGAPPAPSSWHGTHTAGTTAEMTNNSIGMAGIAHNAKVLPVRVLGRCGGYLSDIADAITWASGGTVAGIPANANPAEVINMSLGGSGACGAVYQDAINGAVNRGTLVVVAAGNSAADATNFRPANCDNVVSVGATRITGGIASYSNFGSKVDLAAPGGGGSVDGNPNGYVWQAGSDSDTGPNDGAYSYFGMIGTSMAAPHVAGVAALVQSALAGAEKDPLSPAALEQLLKDTARPFPVAPPSNKPLGSGIVDAKAALDEALEEPCNPDTEDCGTPLVNKVPVSGQSGAAGDEVLFTFEAEAGALLSIMTYGGTGNVSLYVKFDSQPTPTSFDAKSTRPGNSETVRFTAPEAGTYYIKLVGVTGFNGVTIVARQ